MWINELLKFGLIEVVGPEPWNYAQEIRVGLLYNLIQAELEEAGIK